MCPISLSLEDWRASCKKPLAGQIYVYFCCNYGDMDKKLNALLSTPCSLSIRPVSSVVMGIFLCGLNKICKTGINSLQSRLPLSTIWFLSQFCGFRGFPCRGNRDTQHSRGICCMFYTDIHLPSFISSHIQHITLSRYILCSIMFKTVPSSSVEIIACWKR